jgi:hypothetical protein
MGRRAADPRSAATRTNGALAAVENAIAPGGGPPLHVHANEGKALCLVEGKLRSGSMADVAADARRLLRVFVPRGTTHGGSAGGPRLTLSVCRAGPTASLSTLGPQRFGYEQLGGPLPLG